MNPTDIVAVATGTTGAVGLLIYIVKTLWASHEKQDADVRAQRDAALADGRAQTAASVKLADAVEKLVERDARRARVKP